MIDPVIKWSGSKRSQADALVELFPEFETYYEPFLGGGSVLYAVLEKRKPDFAVASDICKPLIDLWRLIQQDPETLVRAYTKDWERLQSQGHTIFYEIRDRFNENQNPEDLFFLSRTCVNGLIRFNSNGEFNNSLHYTRRGIQPSRIEKIIKDWSKVIKKVEFIHGDYKEILKMATSSDFAYLDPPYFNTRGRYYGKIDYEEFVSALHDLNNKGVHYVLSYDGMRGDIVYPTKLPEEVYERHLLLKSGNSSFKKVMDKMNQSVFESVYLDF
ncbi:D12 class N6 adenine-specific DNA methyltransferase [Candidatus Gugararchaeum adminiculabundum]|nr:D12 class N6 adenine-specific DNA methyltransferase [Candidatus Gugararchaeum adminiculabundum]